jgi:hypothetical protein
MSRHITEYLKRKNAEAAICQHVFNRSGDLDRLFGKMCSKCGVSEKGWKGEGPLGMASRSIPKGTEARVCQDIAERQQKGIAKYGVTVEENPLSLREWLQHAFEETLDNAVYLKRAIEEMEK